MTMFAVSCSAGTIRAEKASLPPIECADSAAHKSCADARDAAPYDTWHRELLRPLRLHLDELADTADEPDSGLCGLDADPESIPVPSTDAFPSLK